MLSQFMHRLQTLYWEMERFQSDLSTLRREMPPLLPEERRASAPPGGDEWLAAYT